MAGGRRRLGKVCGEGGAVPSQSGEGKAGLEEGGERRWELPEGERTPEQSPGREGDTRPGRRWGLRCWTRCFYSSVLCAVSGVSDLLVPCERRGESGSCWGGTEGHNK